MNIIAKYYSFVLSLILIGMLPLSSTAQVEVMAELDSNSILIGEQTTLHLSISYSSEGGAKQIIWPNLKDTLRKEIEVVGVSPIDTSVKDKQADVFHLLQTREITITSFDSGYFVIPPFEFIINGDTSNPVLSEALLLEVNTVPVDTSMAIRDIKPPIDEPFDIREILPYLGWGALAAGLLAAIIYLIVSYIKTRKHRPIVEAAPSAPPHIIALEALNRLKECGLWQEGKFKQFHSELSEIIRDYIELRFKVPALEQTTDEILAQFKSLVVAQEYKEQLQYVLSLADLVKFAKTIPIASENEKALEMAFGFVEGTKQEVIPNEEKKDV